METKLCKNCGKEFRKKGNPDYCCQQCAAKHKSKLNYQLYLEDNSRCYGNRHMRNYKKFFLEEQDYKCAICGLPNQWCGQTLVFVLDHIDGNADNNNRDNLRLICPNCDSQLETYKSKNHNSARRKYRKT